MSQNLKKEIPMSKRFFPALLPLIGSEKYEQVYGRYLELYSSHAFPKNPILQRHLTEGILPGLALYQILRESGESQECALEIIDQTFEALFSDQRKKMKMLGRIPCIYPFLRLYIQPAMRQYPPEGWKMDWLQNDKNAIRFDMKSCFYYNTLSQYGAAELTASFCRVDDLIYSDMSTQIQWQRLKTIGRGDTYCDFCFFPVKNPQKS